MKSLNLGLIFIFKSSKNPKRKNYVQNDKYSEKKIFLKMKKYKNTRISKEKIINPPSL